MGKIIKYSLYFLAVCIILYIFFQLRWQCRTSFIQSIAVKEYILKMNKSKLTDSFWYSQMYNAEFLKSLTDDERIEFQSAVLYAFPGLLDGTSGEPPLIFQDVLVLDDARALSENLKQLKSSKSYYCLLWKVSVIDTWQESFEELADYYESPNGKKYLNSLKMDRELYYAK